MAIPFATQLPINCQFTDKKWSHRCILSEIECGQCMNGKNGTRVCVPRIVPAAKRQKQESGREESDSWFQVRNYDASDDATNALRASHNQRLRRPSGKVNTHDRRWTLRAHLLRHLWVGMRRLGTKYSVACIIAFVLTKLYLIAKSHAIRSVTPH